MTTSEYHLEVTKIMNQLDRLKAENARLKILIEHLQKRVDEARPHMAALERDRRTQATYTIDYSYEVK